MARKAKCKGCSVELEAGHKKIHKGKKYCDDCYETVTKDDDKEVSDYKLLIDTICKYFTIDKPTGLILKQIKEYKDTYGYFDSGIGYTLWYMKEIEGIRFDEVKYGIARVKYYYEKAEAYFMQQSMIRESMENHIPEENNKVVVIKNNKIQKNERKSFTLNIDDLLSREGEV